MKIKLVFHTPYGVFTSRPSAELTDEQQTSEAVEFRSQAICDIMRSNEFLRCINDTGGPTVIRANSIVAIESVMLD